MAHGTLDMLDAIVTFQDCADLEPTCASTTSFLDFLHLERAQAVHEHTEQPMTQLGSVSFIDAIGVVFFHFHCVISKS